MGGAPVHDLGVEGAPLKSATNCRTEYAHKRQCGGDPQPKTGRKQTRDGQKTGKRQAEDCGRTTLTTTIEVVRGCRAVALI